MEISKNLAMFCDVLRHLLDQIEVFVLRSVMERHRKKRRFLRREIFFCRFANTPETNSNFADFQRITF